MLVLRRRLKRQAPNTACTPAAYAGAEPARTPAKNAGAGVVGVCAFSGSSRGLRLAPAK